ncbi:MAG TPA: gliding motility protein GldM [Chitinophagaceae bacterium]|nr:gliding motility protein GldM [Chitinophagaceae bacterium]
MALPREPRQKMINMMYLVLTALLALNVSSEILNAFKTVNNSLQKTNEVITASTNDVMASLQAKLADAGTGEKAKIWYPKAQQVQAYSKSMYDLIDDFKKKISTGAKYDPTSDKDKGVDNLDVTTRVMVEKGDGKVLKQRLEEYKKNIVAELEKKIQDKDLLKTIQNFTSSLPVNTDMPKTKNKSNRTWEAACFHMVPTIAALTILSKFQNDVKTAENKVVTFCHEQVGKVEFRFNQYEAIVGQNSNVLLSGQELEIHAGLAAMNSDQKPVVTIGGAVVPLDDKGLAVWKQKVGSSGKIPVKVSYRDQEGQQKDKIVEVEYTVGQSSAAVQLDNMNVLFIGVDNPVTISGSGSVDQIKSSISGGGGVLNGNGSHRSVRVTQVTDECYITVTTPDGKTTRMQFRVRTIPDPTPMVGTNKSGNIPASYFKSQAGVRALVENFYYKTQFNVTSFRITGDGAGFDDIIEANNTGAEWNEAKNIVNRARAGSFITIEDIYAIGPDGTRRKLTPLIFYLK